MTYIKIITLSLICITTAISAGGGFSKQKRDSMGQGAMRELHQGGNQIVQTNKPAMQNALENTGRNAGLGTLIALGACFSKTGAWIAAGTTAVITSPYFIGGAAIGGAGYGAYKVYRYCNPTSQQMILATQEQSTLVEAQNNLGGVQIDLVKQQSEQKFKS